MKHVDTAALSRRRVLGAMLQAGLLTTLGPMSLARAAAGTSKSRPRYIIQIQCGGGIDAVLTTNPQVRKDVEKWVDIPYGKKGFIPAGDLVFGPHFKSMVSIANQMTIINGVHCGTVGHEIGSTKISRMKRGSMSNVGPSFLDVLGSSRSGQPLACMHLGTLSEHEFSRMSFGSPDKISPGSGITMAGDPNQRGLIDALDGLSEDEVRAMARVLRKEAQGLRSSTSDMEQARLNMISCAAYLEALPKVKKFKAEVWSPDPFKQTIAKNLQRTLWAIENDLTAGVLYRAGVLDWDGHYRSDEVQERWNGRFFTQFVKFIDELGKRKNAHGTLADQTLILVSSELGRFPRLNSNMGKDHMPEIPVMLFGPHVNKGRGKGAVFGQTGRSMEALAVNLKTGKGDPRGHVPNVDDVGTTILRICGMKPEKYGYVGEDLSFLHT